MPLCQSIRSDLHPNKTPNLNGYIPDKYTKFITSILLQITEIEKSRPL